VIFNGFLFFFSLFFFFFVAYIYMRLKRKKEGNTTKRNFQNGNKTRNDSRKRERPGRCLIQLGSESRFIFKRQ
jgi:hypothetical protein